MQHQQQQQQQQPQLSNQPPFLSPVVALGEPWNAVFIL